MVPVVLGEGLVLRPVEPSRYVERQDAPDIRCVSDVDIKDHAVMFTDTYSDKGTLCQGKGI